MHLQDLVLGEEKADRRFKSHIYLYVFRCLMKCNFQHYSQTSENKLSSARSVDIIRHSQKINRCLSATKYLPILTRPVFMALQNWLPRKYVIIPLRRQLLILSIFGISKCLGIFLLCLIFFTDLQTKSLLMTICSLRWVCSHLSTSRFIN